MTIDEILNLASEAINKIYIEGNRAVQIPAMGGDGAKKVVKNQRERIEETAQMKWDEMFPEIEEDKADEEELAELAEQYGVSPDDLGGG